MMKKKIRVGIIGIGNMGSGHARFIKLGLCPNIEITAIADIKMVLYLTILQNSSHPKLWDLPSIHTGHRQQVLTLHTGLKSFRVEFLAFI